MEVMEPAERLFLVQPNNTNLNVYGSIPSAACNLVYIYSLFSIQHGQKHDAIY